MFPIEIKRQLIKHFAIPLRRYQIKEYANNIIKKTRYRSVDRFVSAIKKEKIIKPYTLKARNNKVVTLYCSKSLKNRTSYELATAMFPQGYFCNLSSIYYHSLTNQIPKSVYICHETISAWQKKSVRHKNNVNHINNTAIRSAFIKPHRYTNNIFDFNRHEIVVVDRVKDSNYGVIEVHASNTVLPKHSRVTCIERALIDSVVSPHYNGGILSVYGFFKVARRKLNITKLIRIYRDLDFVYPYSQSIGFLLDKVGMKKYALNIYEEFPPSRTFFVDHDAKTSWSYNDKWKLYYPKGLVDEN